MYPFTFEQFITKKKASIRNQYEMYGRVELGICTNTYIIVVSLIINDIMTCWNCEKLQSFELYIHEHHPKPIITLKLGFTQPNGGSAGITIKEDITKFTGMSRSPGKKLGELCHQLYNQTAPHMLDVLNARE